MKIITRLGLITFSLIILTLSIVNAQCPSGYNQYRLDWDSHDFIPNTGSYVAPTPYVTLAQSQTQRFVFGTQKVTITHNYAGARDPGDNTTNTAAGISYGNGADVEFVGNGQITVTFDQPVQNVQFSLYDIDRNQRAVVTALNGVVPVVITNMIRVSGTTLTIVGAGTPTATASANNTTVANNNTNAAVNVDIAGPVTSFTITITNTGTCSSSCGTGGNENGAFWLSDIIGCYTGNFPMNYYAVSTPFTGQPAYVLAVKDDSVFYVNPANGVARFLFWDNSNNNINSMAYDPYNHMVYYTYSLTGPGGTINPNQRTLHRYDYDMDTLGIVEADVRNLGVPLFDQGVESGAAAFYNGSLYLGIEAGTSVSDREAMIWKIDFDPSFAALGDATQVYGTQSNIHDWGDFGIYDGILYDFDGRTGGNEDFYHKNMSDGLTVQFNNNPSSLVPRQVGIDYTGQVYNIGSPNTISSGTIVPYNYNGSVNVPLTRNLYYNGYNPVGSWGDAAEAFKPKTDFGDAPASYDPAGNDPGTHERNDSIRLGATIGIEWNKKPPFDATGDGAEEDAIAGIQIIPTGISNFNVNADVYNNTGRNADLLAWIDANGNGLFDATEGIAVTVPSSALMQTITLTWTGINVLLPPSTTTYMRLRLATADQGLNTSRPNGYADNGEIEDYQVSVVRVLDDKKISLTAQKTDVQKVSLVWNVNEEMGLANYELQKSVDGINWTVLATRTANGLNPNTAQYSSIDENPFVPVTYFRVKANTRDGKVFYSDTKKVDFGSKYSLAVSPNPAKNLAKLSIASTNAGTVLISMFDYSGRKVMHTKASVNKGNNSFDLAGMEKLPNGVYVIKVVLNDEVLQTSLIIAR